jgi:hypothetical protein
MYFFIDLLHINYFGYSENMFLNSSNILEIIVSGKQTF